MPRRTRGRRRAVAVVAGFPDGMTPLFDTIIHTAATEDTGALVYLVEISDPYPDGPHVPSSIVTTKAFSSLDEAVVWAQRAIQAVAHARE